MGQGKPEWEDARSGCRMHLTDCIRDGLRFIDESVAARLLIA